MRLFHYIFVFFLLLTISGCGLKGSLRTRERVYLTASSIQPLRIPPGISSSSFHSYYPVSNKYFPESAKEVSLVPPGLYDNLTS